MPQDQNGGFYGIQDPTLLLLIASLYGGLSATIPTLGLTLSFNLYYHSRINLQNILDKIDIESEAKKLWEYFNRDEGNVKDGRIIS